MPQHQSATHRPALPPGQTAGGAALPAAGAWRIAQAQWLPAQAARDETLFALADGALGVRGGFEESSSPTQGTFIAGVWERNAILYHERHHGFARRADLQPGYRAAV